MAADQQFCLRWNNHQSTLIQVFDTLLASEQLVDCTLAAEGQYLKAHKVVLSACSPYLELLLAQHYEKHPIVILKDVKFQELKSMMDYMYRGEVNISQDQLSTFLKAAESLQIKGLTDSGEDSRDVGSTKRVDGAAQGARKAAAATGAAAASSGSNRASPAVGGTGLTIEPRPASPHHRDASLSPTPRKRRRARRPSQGDAPDSHNDTSNSCDLPPASALAPPEQHIETEHINNRLQNSNNMELIKEKVEPTPELMIEPKTEYMDENNEDSVEDLTLDDDDDLDMNRSGMDMGRPGPSHGDSNQGFATSWHMQGDRSGTDEVFMAAQEAVGAAHRDSQDSRSKGLPTVEPNQLAQEPCQADRTPQFHSSTQPKAFEEIRIKQEVEDEKPPPPAERINQEEFENIFVKQEIIFDDNFTSSIYSNDFLLELSGNSDSISGVSGTADKTPLSSDITQPQTSEKIEPPCSFQTSSHETRNAEKNQVEKRSGRNREVCGKVCLKGKFGDKGIQTPQSVDNMQPGTSGNVGAPFSIKNRLPSEKTSNVEVQKSNFEKPKACSKTNLKEKFVNKAIKNPQALVHPVVPENNRSSHSLQIIPHEKSNAQSNQIEKGYFENSKTCETIISLKDKITDNSLSSTVPHLEPSVSIIKSSFPSKTSSNEPKKAGSDQVGKKSSENPKNCEKTSSKGNHGKVIRNSSSSICTLIKPSVTQNPPSTSNDHTETSVPRNVTFSSSSQIRPSSVTQNAPSSLSHIKPAVSIIIKPCSFENPSREKPDNPECDQVKSGSTTKPESWKSTCLKGNSGNNDSHEIPSIKVSQLESPVSTLKGSVGDEAKKCPSSKLPQLKPSVSITSCSSQTPSQESINPEIKQVRDGHAENSKLGKNLSLIGNSGKNNTRNSLSISLPHLDPSVSIVRLSYPLPNHPRENINAKADQVRRLFRNVESEKHISDDAVQNQTLPSLNQQGEAGVSGGSQSSQNSREPCNTRSYQVGRRRSSGELCNSIDLERVKKTTLEQKPSTSGIIQHKRQSESAGKNILEQKLSSPGLTTISIQPEASSSSMANPLHKSSVKPNTTRVDTVGKIAARNNRKFYCPFCKTLVSDLPRHLSRLHSGEKEVQQYLKYEKHSQERVQLLRLLKNRGEKLHFLEAIKNKRALRNSSSVNQSKSLKNLNYCPFCIKPAKDLPRHLGKVHPDEREVKELMKECDKKSPKRIELLKLFRSRGTLLHNLEVRKKRNISVRKLLYCPFCRKGVATNLPRHLERLHAGEQEVIDFMRFDKKSQQRIELLAVLRLRGERLHNLEATNYVKISL